MAMVELRYCDMESMTMAISFLVAGASYHCKIRRILLLQEKRMWRTHRRASRHIMIVSILEMNRSSQFKQKQDCMSSNER